MDWFRESQADPSLLTYLTTTTVDIPAPSDDVIVTSDSEICSQPPSTHVDASLMDRSLCPWEWTVDRDDNREPKLISVAVCQCQTARGQLSAECMPIRREVPVLRRIFCDDSGRFHYRKEYETVTVGCHAVMARMQRAAVPQWLLGN